MKAPTVWNAIQSNLSLSNRILGDQVVSIGWEKLKQVINSAGSSVKLNQHILPPFTTCSLQRVFALDRFYFSFHN